MVYESARIAVVEKLPPVCGVFDPQQTRVAYVLWVFYLSKVSEARGEGVRFNARARAAMLRLVLLSMDREPALPRRKAPPVKFAPHLLIN